MKQLRFVDTVFLFLNENGEVLYSSEDIGLIGLTYEEIFEILKMNNPFFKCKDHEISKRKIKGETESFYVVKIVCKDVKKIAYIDSLTNLYNRNIWEKVKKRGLEKDCFNKNTLIVIDMDNLKNINDAKGHLAGDKCIKIVANSIKECIRGDDMAFRIGGDEFVVLLVNADKSQAQGVVARIRNKIKDKLAHMDNSISISAGISIFDSFAQIDEAFKKADMKMYKEKQNKECNEISAGLAKLHRNINNILASDIDKTNIIKVIKKINVFLDSDVAPQKLSTNRINI